MTSQSFIFFFYEVKNACGEIKYLSHGLRVEPDPNGRYGRYFMSFWFELPNESYTKNLLTQLDSLEKGIVSEIHLGGDEWSIHLSLERVTFTHNQFDEWNDGFNNIFSYKEFKCILVVWDKFLSIPPEQSGNEYKFILPDGDISSALNNDIILIPNT